MKITINPITEQLQAHVKKHGADGWVILRNDPACCQRSGQRAILVCKNNQMLWLVPKEIIA